VATAQAVKPDRGLAWVRKESTSTSLAVLGVGAVAILLVILGTALILILNGFTPVEAVERAFKSNETKFICLWSVVLGVASVLGALLTAKKMPTKVSREQAIAGGVLGAQAIVLGVLLWVFSSGDVHKFAINYLDFAPVQKQFPAFLHAARNTVFLALTSELAGIVLGLALAGFASSARAVVRAPARTYINFFRGTPLLWQIVFIGVGIPLGLGINISTYTAAVIALSLNMGAYSAEVFRAGIQSIEKSQLEAARGLGMSYMQAMRYAIVPQAVRRVIPPLMNEFVILVKDTSLVLFLGLATNERDLLSWGNQGYGNTFNATFLIYTALGYLAICLPAIRLVNVLEKRLRSGLVGVGA
jgi:His/Glu/Gln/Arg/opine family amino acid ABC transporter permease subunit